MKKILVVNAGSSSLKWAFYSYDQLELFANGLCERITEPMGKVIIKYGNGQKFEKEVVLPNHTVAVQELLTSWKELKLIDSLDDISAIGFRTPYSGHDFLSPVVYSPEVKKGIEEAAKFIPLHAPATLAAIAGFEVHLPEVVKIIAQDTAFHTTIPTVNATFPINKKWAAKFNIKKFGYHGLSHNYIAEKAKEILSVPKPNVVVAHLGSGSSICAVKNGESVDVTVGFSSFDGLPMGTRCGGIDPGITDYLTRIEGQSQDEVFNMLVKKSGLLGVSGVSNDVRDLHAVYDTNPDAKLALDIFVARIVDYVAMYLNKVGKPDALIFTAGIGENDEIIRQRVIDGLSLFNFELDQEANLAKYDDFKLISTADSKIPVYKVRTNEEIVIARYVKQLLNH
ncbi:acetate/propionate family kinase [Mycoplasmopsis columbinasalis]|uniref:Acetate kinase n=1 Tax=Mycoplasmopsis columbinasalis TaxID=114880 RepID=A0A449BAR9_9BACT|nr:acetate/propionate family kinase [Mycoplasmopsis columbinasalis]VEU78303.1 Acetate kinase [Mycoplasmopsis columbinasalis]